MISKIHETLISLKYLRIESNVPFITLFAQFDISSAKVIQVIDCEESIPITQEQYLVFCQKAKEHIRDRGFEDIEFLSLIVTGDISEARKFVLDDDRCWIYDSINGSVVIYDNEPEDFYGLKRILDGLYVKGTGIYGDFEDESVPEKGSYKGYYKNDSLSSNSFIEQLTPVNTILVIINVIVFFWMTFTGSTEDVEFMIGHGTMFVPSIIVDKEYYRFFTCFFQHFGFSHLAGNMVVLLFLGDNVERAVGTVKYLILYIFSGLIGSVGSFLYAYVYNQGIVSAGASGAIFGIIGAMLLIVIKNRGKHEEMTTLRVCVLIAYALYNGLTSENVDMAAHLFGLFGGFLLALLIYRREDKL